MVETQSHTYIILIRLFKRLYLPCARAYFNNQVELQACETF